MRKNKEQKITEGELRVWLISGSHIDVTVEYEEGELESVETELNATTGRVYLSTNISAGYCLTLKAEGIAGYEWLP